MTSKSWSVLISFPIFVLLALEVFFIPRFVTPHRHLWVKNTRSHEIGEILQNMPKFINKTKFYFKKCLLRTLVSLFWIFHFFPAP